MEEEDLLLEEDLFLLEEEDLLLLLKEEDLLLLEERRRSYNAGSKRFSQVQQGSKRFNVCAGSNRTDGPPKTPLKGSPPRKGSVQVQVFWIRRSAMRIQQNTLEYNLVHCPGIH